MEDAGGTLSRDVVWLVLDCHHRRNLDYGASGGLMRDMPWALFVDLNAAFRVFMDHGHCYAADGVDCADYATASYCISSAGSGGFGGLHHNRLPSCDGHAATMTIVLVRGIIAGCADGVLRDVLWNRVTRVEYADI